ncbi:hypothetical protein [Acinetobacter rudis]|uniref:Uncharacterized protein n=1 Tax=Acinetobacter rudis CIP 110305 TaxID=421052 RepID=S3P122_9GAMM|nr:hypothetical protein [Acinetobacter rudis]EPF80099.1 hypothetical protein F945_00551 [Acinetobacter rudis CIP 110305]
MKFVVPVLTLFTIVFTQQLYAAKRLSSVDSDYAEAVKAATEAAEEAQALGATSDCDGQSCTVAAVSCDDDPNAEVCNVQPTYGGIKQRYVVKGCRVTIYNDGPVEMVHEKTGKWCDAPLPKDHVFNQPTRSYQDNSGCQISEYTSVSGLGVGVADCSNAPPSKSK